MHEKIEGPGKAGFLPSFTASYGMGHLIYDARLAGSFNKKEKQYLMFKMVQLSGHLLYNALGPYDARAW